MQPLRIYPCFSSGPTLMCILSALSGLSEFGERNGRVAKELEGREKRVNLIKTHNIHV